jgi:hypothetical protein
VPGDVVLLSAGAIPGDGVFFRQSLLCRSGCTDRRNIPRRQDARHRQRKRHGSALMRIWNQRAQQRTAEVLIVETGTNTAFGQIMSA